MATITVQAKAQPVYNMDDTLAYELIQIPVLARRHCDMDAFRRHAKYGGLANSDLFPNVLSKLRRDLFGDNGQMRLDRVPCGVSVDRSGFLAKIIITV